MHDPFEASLKALLNTPANAQDEEGDEDGQTALQLGGHGELERLAECKQI